MNNKVPDTTCFRSVRFSDSLSLEFDQLTQQHRFDLMISYMNWIRLNRGPTQGPERLTASGSLGQL